MEGFLLLFLLPLLALLLPLFGLKPLQNRTALLFFLTLHFVYFIWVPATDRWMGIQSFFGYTLSFDSALDRLICGIYCLALSSFWFGYFLSGKVSFPWRFRQPNFDRDKAISVLYAVQMFVWILVLWNVLSSGMSVPGILNPSNQSEKDILFSAEWRYPWIDLLSNVLPVCLFLQYYFKPRISGLWVFFLVIWLGFSLLGGWRYRIILFCLFLVIHALVHQKWNLRIWLPAVFLLTVSMAWLTLNRMAIAKRQFHLITFDLRQFDFAAFNMEFSNSRTFRASLEFMQEHHVTHPGISAWTDVIRNKLQNRDSFPEGKRPRPWILDATKAWIPSGWPWNPNPAVSQLEEFFLTFGWLGMALGMFVVGCWVRILDSPRPDLLWNAFRIVGTALLFQWISRGFFLFQAQITLVCLIPFVVLMVLGSYLPDESKPDEA